LTTLNSRSIYFHYLPTRAANARRGRSSVLRIAPRPPVYGRSDTGEAETKSYLFIKLPDRILLIDPDTKTVAEIVGAAATTGSSQGGTNPMNPGAPPR
jgi:hypothetical protein